MTVANSLLLVDALSRLFITTFYLYEPSAELSAFADSFPLTYYNKSSNADLPTTSECDYSERDYLKAQLAALRQSLHLSRVRQDKLSIAL